MGEEYTATRRSLHAVAELVLAGPQYRATGRLRLRVAPGGFATTETPDLRVEGPLVVAAGGGRVPIHGSTSRALGEALGVVAGRPDDVYRGGSGMGLETRLELWPEELETIMSSFALGHTALTAFAPDESPTLWPEHFDVAIRVDDTNFGVSPGDSFSADPYAYVGVTNPTPNRFWNAPFGATLPLRQTPVADVVAFFTTGRDLYAAR